MNADTPEGRAAIIAELERTNRARVEQHLAKMRRYELAQAAINQAFALYVDMMTAPMRAFAEQIRADIATGRRRP